MFCTPRLPHLCRRYSNVAVKLLHRSDVNRLKNDGMTMTSENVLTNRYNKDGMSITFPTASMPTRLQVTVPRKNYNSSAVFEHDSLEEGMFKNHYVGENAYSENMLQYAKANDAPEAPQGDQGFLWRLSRPFEAFKKRFMGDEDIAQETKAKVEPIKTTHEEQHPQNEQHMQGAPTKGSMGPPKSP